MKWKPYPKYKDSRIAWLGKIPNHWGITPLRYLAQPQARAFTDGDWIESPYIRDNGIRLIQTGNIGVGDFRDQGFRYIDHTTFKILRCTEVKPNDVLICRLADPVGRACLAPALGVPMITSVDISILKPGDGVDAGFVVYSLSSSQYLAWMASICRGGTRDRISRSMLGAIRLQKPCFPEQQAIARFLDRETGRIDALIEKKKRQIELLQEKRAALISHAVTKGLNPNAEMKDSGIEWLGQIPAHWEIVRLKYLSDLQTGLTLGKRYSGSQAVTRPYLRVANVQDGYLDLKTITEIRIPPSEAGRYELRHGDVLMTEGGDFDKLGRGYVWEGQISGCLHQNHIFAVRPKQSRLRSRYLAAVLTSSHGKSYFTSTSQQTTNLATTNSRKLRDFPLPLPPHPEQQGILAEIDDLTRQVGRLSERVSLTIGLLREYRSALISAAVTGKIDVREEVA